MGEFSARGQLSPASYIVDRDCRLTGGFAFCVWFKPHRRAGDFVVTFGGYHPDFKAPAHYPTVPRLGVAWTPRGVPLKLRGSQYFALTPGLVMTGGLLEANWDKGPLRARFTIQADFLVRWAPFDYEARLGVTFSLEVNLGKWLKHTVSANVGADLHLWGPPFSGRAQIDFGVMSFAIEFGADAPSPRTYLGWSEFQEQLLGEQATLLRLRVRGGLLAELAPGRFTVDAEQFEAASELRVPASTVALHGVERNAREFDIAPMNLARGSFESKHDAPRRAVDAGRLGGLRRPRLGAADRDRGPQGPVGAAGGKPAQRARRQGDGRRPVDGRPSDARAPPPIPRTRPCRGTRGRATRPSGPHGCGTSPRSARPPTPPTTTVVTSSRARSSPRTSPPSVPRSSASCSAPTCGSTSTGSPIARRLGLRSAPRLAAVTER